MLKPGTIKLMFTPDPVVVNVKSIKLHQGLIWELAPLGDDMIAMHPGGDPGASTLAAIDAAHGSAALCFMNITPTKDKMPLEKDVIRRLLEKAHA